MNLDLSNELLRDVDLLVCAGCGSAPVTHVLVSCDRHILEPLRIYCVECAFGDDGLDEDTVGPIRESRRMACWVCSCEAADRITTIEVGATSDDDCLSLFPTYEIDDLCSRDSRMCAICDQQLQAGHADGRKRALGLEPDLPEAEFQARSMAFRRGHVDGFVDAEWRNRDQNPAGKGR